MPCTTLYKMHRASSSPPPSPPSSIYHSFPLDIQYYKHHIIDINFPYGPQKQPSFQPTYISLAAITYIFILFFFPVLGFYSLPLCCRLMIHFIQMRETLVVIGSIRGCIVGYLRHIKEECKKRRSNNAYLGLLDLRSRGKFSFGVLLSIYEDCKARTKGFKLFRGRGLDWYFF